MTTPNTPAPGMAHVQITWTDSQVSMLSCPSGKTLTFDFMSWDSLVATERTFLVGLMQGNSPRSMTLSYADMKRFATLCGSPPVSSGPVQNPTIAALKDETVQKNSNPPVVAPVPSQKAMFVTTDAGNSKSPAVSQEACKISGQQMVNKLSDNVAPHVSVNPDAAEKRIAQLRSVIDTIPEGRYVMLVYDIPTTKNDECPNPSGLLWHHGFRMNLSCWVLPATELSHYRIKRLLSHWEEHKIKTHIVPYAKEAMVQIKQIARENLDEEIRRIHTSLIETIGSADDRLAEAIKEMDAQEAAGQEVTSKQRQTIDAGRDNRVRQIIRSAGERLDAAIDCAKAFDERETLSDLLQGLREAINARAKAFNAAMAVKGSKPAPIVK